MDWNTGRRCAFTAGLLFLSVSVFAQAVPDSGARLQPGVEAVGLKVPVNEIEIGGSRENLNNGYADWSSIYLLGSRKLGERNTLYGGLRETSRFDLDDTEAHAGLYFPLGQTWTGVIEGVVSPTHNVLARHSVYGQIHKSLPGGWGLGFGARRSEYTATASSVISVIAERYWSNFRGAYTLYSGKPDGASSAASHRFQLSYYYADLSSVGLSYTNGREVENVGAPRGVITSDVSNWTLSGRHWFTPSSALTYDLVYHEQGSFYRRQGLQLGLRHRF